MYLHRIFLEYEAQLERCTTCWLCRTSTPEESSLLVAWPFRDSLDIRWHQLSILWLRSSTISLSTSAQWISPPLPNANANQNWCRPVRHSGLFLDHPITERILYLILKIVEFSLDRFESGENAKRFESRSVFARSQPVAIDSHGNRTLFRNVESNGELLSLRNT